MVHGIITSKANFIQAYVSGGTILAFFNLTTRKMFETIKAMIITTKTAKREISMMKSLLFSSTTVDSVAVSAITTGAITA